MTLPFDTFVFSARSLAGRTARFGYRLLGGGREAAFEETFELPVDLERSAASAADVAAALAGLHRIAGISYWKTCCPPRIVIEGDGPAALGSHGSHGSHGPPASEGSRGSAGPPAPLGSPGYHDAGDAAFWSEVYNAGLGEFYYRNGLDPAGSARFPGAPSGAGAAPPAPPSSASTSSTAGAINGSTDPAAAGPPLVLAGGGKDSVVAWEIVSAAAAANGGGKPVPLTVVPAGQDWHLAPDRGDGRALRVARRLDPLLFELNAAGAYNGHVPFSAILAFTAQLVAVVGGFGAIVAANERSASAGNLTAGGVEVNHQWSKGLRFEGLFQEWQRRHLARVPVYFSLLRPLGELRIASLFAGFPGWFGAVTSCNTNFRQRGGPGTRWCGRCAKCVFAAIVLTPWLDADGVSAVFGNNPLADPENLPVIKTLLGQGDHKPWDCVGTPGEVAAALWLAGRRDPDSRLPALRWFRDHAAASLADPEEQVRRELASSPDHHLPPRWRDALAKFLDAR